MRTPYFGSLGVACCAFFLVCPVHTVAQSNSASPRDSQGSAQSEPARKNSVAAEPSLRASSELPDSPGSTLLQLQSSEPGQQQDGTAQSPNSGSAPQAVPPVQSQDQNAPAQKPQRPVGTAAAEAPKVSGITAAQPAGVAIAPAKQHRVRTIVLRVGAIAGAGAALGTVIALTAATPSKPPGAH
jgi:hypothetical protein